MGRKWITPALFGVGTFLIITGAMVAVGALEARINPTALSMIGIGFFMLGLARIRSQSSKFRRKP